LTGAREGRIEKKVRKIIEPLRSGLRGWEMHSFFEQVRGDRLDRTSLHDSLAGQLSPHLGCDINCDSHGRTLFLRRFQSNSCRSGRFVALKNSPVLLQTS
jgi:hypothetical protein